MNASMRTAKYVFLFITVLIALCGSLLAQPSVNTLTFTPATINTAGAPASVTVNFNITGQGVYYLATAFADPSGNTIGHQIDKSFTPANTVTDSVVIAFPAFSPSGTYRIAYIFALDANGFVYLSTPDAVTAAFPVLGSLTVSSTQDITAPSLTSFTLTPNTVNTSAASATVTVGFTLTDDLSGANFFQIVLTSPSGNATQLATKSFTAATSVTDSATLTFPQFSEAGTWTVTNVFLGDAAGNTSVLAPSDLAGKGPSSITVTSTPDTTPPTLTAFNFTPTSINVTGVPATVTFSFQGTDDLSGVTSFQASFVSPSSTFVNASTTFASSTSVTGTATATFPMGSENGTWTIGSVTLSDAAGNTHVYAASDLTGLGPTQLTVVNATGDTTPPVVTPTISPAPNGTGWNSTTPVNITWAVSDPESGIVSSSGCTNGSVSGQTSGLSFTCSATNGVGLTTTVTAVIRIDLTPPVITPIVSPTPTAAGWTNAATTVSWNLSDPTSGIDTGSDVGCGVVTVNPETAGTVLTCMGVNGAGLAASASFTVKIDVTPPTAFASATPAPNGAGWNNTNVTVAFAGTDALSGIAGCSAPAVLSTEGTGQSASGTCTDNAGNVSAPAVASGIKIDKTAPVASNVVATPNPVPLNTSTNLTATITDSLSGVASAAYNVDGGSFSAMNGTFGGTTANVSVTTPAFTTTGTHTVCVRGADVAGNTGATTCISVLVPVATVFVGLKNSDDQGTNFDIQVDMLRNGTVAASGLVRCVTGLVRTTSSAKQVAIPFTSGNGVPAVSGDVVSFRVSARIGTNADGTACGGHASAVGLDLYYDSTTQNSRFSPGIPMGTSSDFFLHTSGTTDLFNNTAPTATTSQVRESAGVHFSGGNPFAVVGTWSRTQP